MMESIIVTVMIYILTPGAIKIDASSRNDDEKLSGELLFRNNLRGENGVLVFTYLIFTCSGGFVSDSTDQEGFSIFKLCERFNVSANKDG